MIDRVILIVASAVNSIGLFVLVSSSGWGIPGLLRIGISAVLVGLNVLLFRYRKEVRDTGLKSGRSSDFADRPLKAAKAQGMIASVMIIVALAGPFWMPLANQAPPILVRYQIISSLISAVVIPGVFVLIWKKRRLLVRDAARSMIVGMAVAVPLLCYDILGLARSNAVRRIGAKMNVLSVALSSRPKSIESVEEYLKDLRAIDPGFAPHEFMEHLKDYTDGFEAQIIAYSAKDLSRGNAENQKTKDALEALASSATKFE